MHCKDPKFLDRQIWVNSEDPDQTVPGLFGPHQLDALLNGKTTLFKEPQHDKTNKMSVRPAKTQISLGICPVWSESSLSPRNLGCLATHWAHSEDSDQTGQMPRLIWVFAGRTLILSVLSCHGSKFRTTKAIFIGIQIYWTSMVVTECKIL